MATAMERAATDANPVLVHQQQVCVTLDGVPIRACRESDVFSAAAGAPRRPYLRRPDAAPSSFQGQNLFLLRRSGPFGFCPKFLLTRRSALHM